MMVFSSGLRDGLEPARIIAHGPRRVKKPDAQAAERRRKPPRNTDKARQ
jgi:hypothetical protein